MAETKIETTIEVKTEEQEEQTPATEAAAVADEAADATSNNENAVILFVNNIAFKTDADSMRQHFSQAGTVKDCRVIKKRGDKFGKNQAWKKKKVFAFVEFHTKEEGQKAIDMLNESELDGRKIFVNFSKPKEPGSERKSVTANGSDGAADGASAGLTEREKATQSLVDKLKVAGEEGTHFDELVKTLEKTKREVQSTLFMLQNSATVQRLAGNKWRLKPVPVAPARPPPAVKSVKSVQQQPMAAHHADKVVFQGQVYQRVGNANAYNSFSQPAVSYVHPEGLPSIKLPGQEKYSSYKNSLQEYSDKMKHAPENRPKYTKEKKANGMYYSNVKVGTVDVGGAIGMKTAKEAELLAAFEALKSLKYLPGDAVFQEAPKIIQLGQKRKSDDPSTGGATPSKQMQMPQPYLPMMGQELQSPQIARPQIALPKQQYVPPDFASDATSGNFF